LGWGRRRTNRGGEGRQSGHILTFVDGITNGLLLSVILSVNGESITSLYGDPDLNPSVIPSANLMVNLSRHCTEISTEFETELFSSVKIADGKFPLMLSDFLVVVGNSDGESITSLYGAASLNPSVIPSVKSPAKTSTSANRPFFYSEYSVYNSVSIYRRNYR